MQDHNLQELSPISPIQYYILFVLIGNTMHGYEIMQEIEKQMGKATPTATLYRVLRRMLRGNLIKTVDSPNPQEDDPRRRYYQITNYGQKIFETQTQQWKELTKKAEKRIQGEAEQASI